MNPLNELSYNIFLNNPSNSVGKGMLHFNFYGKDHTHDIAVKVLSAEKQEKIRSNQGRLNVIRSQRWVPLQIRDQVILVKIKSIKNIIGNNNFVIKEIFNFNNPVFFDLVREKQLSQFSRVDDEKTEKFFNAFQKKTISSAGQARALLNFSVEKSLSFEETMEIYLFVKENGNGFFSSDKKKANVDFKKIALLFDVQKQCGVSLKDAFPILIFSMNKKISYMEAKLQIEPFFSSLHFSSILLLSIQSNMSLAQAEGMAEEFLRLNPELMPLDVELTLKYAVSSKIPLDRAKDEILKLRQSNQYSNSECNLILNYIVNSSKSIGRVLNDIQHSNREKMSLTRLLSTFSYQDDQGISFIKAKKQIESFQKIHNLSGKKLLPILNYRNQFGITLGQAKREVDAFFKTNINKEQKEFIINYSKDFNKSLRESALEILSFSHENLLNEAEFTCILKYRQAFKLSLAEAKSLVEQLLHDQLSIQEILKIASLVEDNSTKWEKDAELTSDSPLYLQRKDHPSLVRNLQVNRNPDGSLEFFILFNRLMSGDKMLGKGAMKMVKQALDLKTGMMYARLTMEKGESSEAEIETLKMVGNRDGVSKTLLNSFVIYKSKKSEDIDKVAYIQALYSGDLEQISKKRALSDEEFKLVAHQLLRALVHLHDDNILHRDIKLGNIMVNTTGEMIDEVVISDFGSSCHADDDEAKSQADGTIFYNPPEYCVSPRPHEEHENQDIQELSKEELTERIRQIDKERKKEIREITLNATTTKLDVWATGITLLQLCEDRVEDWKDNPYKQILQMPPFEQRAAIANLEEDWLHKPGNVNSVEHLIWKMLRPNPEDRIDSREALAELEALLYRK